MDWQKKSYSLSAGSHTFKWVYSKDSSGTAGSDCGWVDGLKVGTTSFVGQPDAMSEALDSNLKFTQSGTGTWYNVSGTTHEYYYEADSAESEASEGEEALLQAIVDSPDSETVKFYWKVSSVQGYDYLQFYIDETLKDQISGEVAWTQKSYPVDPGIHILKWRFIKNSSGSSGDNCGWVDFVQWTGPAPAQDPANWQEIAYKQDVTGRRRVEKKVDGYSTRYVHDREHIIAEYDGNNNLLRKYIYGPGTDQPISMTEVADANATYYYHFDGLGSVVALSNASGNTVQTYEYSVYGEVAVEDANHTNPFMFAGVRYDIEIGLYYNRARYYNPFTGRFLQTDPIGYSVGMNLYAYCGNNPIRFVDPSGLNPEPCPVCGNEKGSCYDLWVGRDPCWTEVTGSIMTLPYQLDPRKLSLIENLDNYLELATGIKGIKFKAGVALNLWQQDWAAAVKKVANPHRVLVSAYLQTMKKLAEIIPKIVSKTAWRAFFEVQVYRWKKDNRGNYVEENGHRVKEAINKPYWVEVINMRGHTPGGGYLRIEDAYQAAVRGRAFWYCSELGQPERDDWYSEDEGGGVGFYGQTFVWEGVDVPDFGF